MAELLGAESSERFIRFEGKWNTLKGNRKQQKPVLESVSFLRSLRLVRLSSSLSLTEEEQIVSPQRKLLKVAIIGRPNAGKSTLINKILNLNLCGVSCKTHTTKTPIRAAFTQGETQIVFLDTPGLVTKKEYARFNLSEEFLTWKETALVDADVVGVVHEVVEPRDIFKLHLNLSQNINELPASKPVFLVFSKIDMVMDKDAFSAAVDRCLRPTNLENPKSEKQPKFWQRFSKVFFTSAVNGKGLDAVSNYLLGQAKPGEWLFQPGQVCDKPLDQIVKDLLRAKLLNVLPNEVPYQCQYEVEYLKENDLGEVVCVSLVTCKNNSHYHVITSGRRHNLKTLCKELESDLYKILGKVFRLRLVVQVEKK